MSMTPEQQAAIKGLRDAGFAVSYFEPEELRGASQKKVEGLMDGAGRDAIDSLATWLHPSNDPQDNVLVDITYDHNMNLVGITEVQAQGTYANASAKVVDIQKLKKNDLEGAYVTDVIVTSPIKEEDSTGQDSPLATLDGVKTMLRSIGMGYGQYIDVSYQDCAEGDSSIKLLALVNRELTKLSQYSEASSDWTQIGMAGTLNVWIRRWSENSGANPVNVFQCLNGPKPPSNTSGGYIVLDTALNMVGAKERFFPNENFPPRGWICASDYTKDSIPDAIYETVLGDIADGDAPYHMTIAHSDGLFTPVHGNCKMEPCESANEAGKMLQEYWDDLPNSSKMLYRPASERQTG